MDEDEVLRFDFGWPLYRNNVVNPSKSRYNWEPSNIGNLVGTHPSKNCPNIRYTMFFLPRFIGKPVRFVRPFLANPKIAWNRHSHIPNRGLWIWYTPSSGMIGMTFITTSQVMVEKKGTVYDGICHSMDGSNPMKYRIWGGWTSIKSQQQLGVNTGLN